MKVTKQLVNAVLAQTSIATLQKYFYEVFVKENKGYGDDMRTMNLLLEGDFKTVEDFNPVVIIPHMDKHIYRFEEKNVHDVCIKSVNNIDGYITVSYKDGEDDYEHETTIDFSTYERYLEEYIASSNAPITDAE